MKLRLTLHRAGPATTVQDLGRPGRIGQGLSVGGAADRLALFEAAALLGSPTPLPAFEMPGMGVTATATADMRLALTGAPMRADIGGKDVHWPGVHLLPAGVALRIGAVRQGNYGYLTPAGGIDGPPWLGSISAHLAAGIGATLADGVTVDIGPDPNTGRTGLTLDPDPRFDGGSLRVIPGPQTELYPRETRARFFATAFRRGPQANRQGLKLDGGDARFTTPAAQDLVSDFIVPGDIQMTGDGVPFVLLCECQTIGGYPRIGTVIPADLPRAAQAPSGAALTPVPVSLTEADAARMTEAETLARLRAAVRPLVRDPRDIPDLLGYQLISGVTRGDGPTPEKT